ncbi:UNVERIFIED_CONTAM: hypothetical protein Slati_2655100 [Sesamum latifolium]|uniref:Reverse transcriptase domain-containing protein n=1 Tax=Sesamum latifolium TaxID=2727402 RepID=A0AAW2VUU5_9LAMI
MMAIMNEDLLRLFSTEEVKDALNQMHPHKLSRPDGMSPIFYQKYWNIVGPNVAACVLDILNNYSIKPQFNAAHIVLISKCPNPDKMTQFRPISFCNVIYKLASKTLANWLKPYLDQIISPMQSAFIPGCLITDNVLVAYEARFMPKTYALNMMYVSTVAYSFLLNEAFSALICQHITWGRLVGVSVASSAPAISHLLFANDTMIFCQATMK